MATIKAISSKAPIRTAIKYVQRDSKTTEGLISGIYCDPAHAIHDMTAVKRRWQKTEGRTYKHYVQSFAPGEVTPEQAHDIGYQLASTCPQWDGYQILIVTHVDREHIHNHLIINSVSCLNGRKLHLSNRDLDEIKQRSDAICSEQGLSICQKGKTHDGKDREDPTAWDKTTYERLLAAQAAAEQSGQHGISWLYDGAEAAMLAAQQATSRAEWCELMSSKGYEVDWQDNHKHIVLIDKARRDAGERKYKARTSRLSDRFKIDLTKEGLSNVFAGNAERAAVINAAITATGNTADASQSAINAASAATERQARDREQQRRNLGATGNQGATVTATRAGAGAAQKGSGGQRGTTSSQGGTTGAVAPRRRRRSRGDDYSR